MPQPEIYVGRKAICQALGLSWPTVLKWIRRRGLPVLREPGFPPSLHPRELAEWHRGRLKGQGDPPPGTGDDPRE